MLTKLKQHTLKILHTKSSKWKFTEHNLMYIISNGVVFNLIPVFIQSIEAFDNLYYLIMHSHFNLSIQFDCLKAALHSVRYKP